MFSMQNIEVGLLLQKKTLEQEYNISGRYKRNHFRTDNPELSTS